MPASQVRRFRKQRDEALAQVADHQRTNQALHLGYEARITTLKMQIVESNRQVHELQAKLSEQELRVHELESQSAERQRSLQKALKYITDNGLPPMPALDKLPVEMIEKIAGELHGKDLFQLRLVCKYISAAATNPFALFYFAERRHVVSPDSINTFVEITAHPLLGKFVKKVMLDSVQMTNIPWPEDLRKIDLLRLFTSDLSQYEHNTYTIQDNFLNSQSLDKQLQRVFENIKGHGNSVTIGLDDGGPLVYWLGTRPQSVYGRAALTQNTDYQYTYLLAKTFDKLISAVERADCSIRGLSVQINFEPSQMFSKQFSLLKNSIQALLDRDPCFHRDIDISLSPWGQEYIKYDSKSRTLDISGYKSMFDFRRNRLPQAFPANVLQQWLLKVPVVVLKLKSCRIENIASFQRFLSSKLDTLRRIDWDTVHVRQPQDWTSIMNILVTSRELSFCRLKKLDSSSDIWRDVSTTPTIEFQDDIAATLLEIGAKLGADEWPWAPTRFLSTKDAHLWERVSISDVTLSPLSPFWPPYSTAV